MLFKKPKNEELEDLVGAKQVDVSDLIAPAGLKIESNYLQIGSKYARTIFAFTYPQTLTTGWLSPIITLDQEMNIALFVHPMETSAVLKNLTKKTAQIQSQISLQAEKGKVRDPRLETALRNVEDLRDKLQQGAERLFKFGLYITFFADSTKELDEIEEKNKNFASFETIKKIVIMPEFSIDNGLLTPTLKMKKSIIIKKYEKEVDALYQDI